MDKETIFPRTFTISIIMIVFNAILLLFTLPETVHAQDKYIGLIEEFDARPLTTEEKRFLQTALAFQGYYSGLLDGKWGKVSQAAIENYSAEIFSKEPTNLNIATLVIDFLANVEEQGWEFQYMPNIGLSMALPMKGMKPAKGKNGTVIWKHATNSLLVEAIRHNFIPLRAYHNKVQKKMALGTALYTLRNRNIWITSAEQSNGEIWYIRSQKISKNWSSVSVTAKPTEKNLLNTVVTSVTKGRASEWRLPPGGHVNKIVSLAAEILKEEERKKGNRQINPGSDKQTKSFGSGFFVNRGGTVLTNAHVVSDCDGISIDFHEMKIDWISEGLDLALLSPKASFPVASTARFALKPARLNTSITVAGYPLPGIISGINITRGAVTGLKGLAGDIKTFQISAAIQKGNSGGPVFYNTGAVVGFVF
jgi:serine protease Do